MIGFFSYKRYQSRFTLRSGDKPIIIFEVTGF